MGRRTSPSRLYWTVVATKSLNGRKAEAEINKQGFETYQPVYRAAPKRGVRRTLPLFPGYLFAKVSRDNWKPIAYTRDVRHVMTISEQPAEISKEEIQALRDLENAKGYIEPEFAQPPSFAPGESVEARAGIFREKFGTYLGFAGTRSDRVRVLFEVLGRAIEHEISAFDLNKVAATA